MLLLTFYVDGKKITKLADKNKKISEEWALLSSEEKEKYSDLAKDASSTCVVSSQSQSWKEAKKIMRNFSANVT